MGLRSTHNGRGLKNGMPTIRCGICAPMVPSRPVGSRFTSISCLPLSFENPRASWALRVRPQSSTRPHKRAPRRIYPTNPMGDKWFRDSFNQVAYFIKKAISVCLCLFLLFVCVCVYLCLLLVVCVCACVFFKFMPLNPFEKYLTTLEQKKNWRWWWS